jgi:hypothetical protein
MAEQTSSPAALIAWLRNLWRRVRLPGWFLPVLGLAYLAAVAAFAFVWIVDPYALRPTGVHARLSAQPYHDHFVPLLFPTAARDGTDLVVVGGSSSAGFMPEMLLAAFPQARKPVNLSFTYASAEDFEAELTGLAGSPSLKRLILSLDFPLITEMPAPYGRIWDKSPYDGAWYNPAPEFSVDAVEASLQVVRTGELSPRGWLSPDQNSPDFLAGWPPLSADPSKMAELARDVDASRGWIVSRPDIACSAMPHLQTVLALVRRIAARGIAVDIVLPPEALGAYADWSVRRAQPGIALAFPEKGSVFASLVSLRRCAVQAMDGVANVRVHGFDTDAALTGDLSLYRDTGHLLRPDTYRMLLDRIARGDAVVRSEQWPAYEATLRQEVQTYRPWASAAKPQAQR